jgi:hypothetical protein
VHVRRADDVEVRDRAERGEVFDGLVRGAVFAEADRVVCEDVDDLHFGQGRETNRGLHVVGEGQERAAVRDEPAVEAHPRHGRAHRVLADAEVEDAPLIKAVPKVAAVLDVCVVRGAEVGAAADEHRHVRRERVDDFAARRARRHRLRVLERREVLLPTFGQLAAHRRVPSAAELFVLLNVTPDERVPLGL